MNKSIAIMCITLGVSVGVPYASAKTLKEAYFAGGCFWCMEQPFEQIDGIEEAISGFSGGKIKKPSYAQVSSGNTEHIEVVKIVYDEDKIDYQTLLNIFWRQIDPTDKGGQFVDRGHQYISTIFYVDDAQRKLAEASKKEVAESGLFDKPIVTDIRKFDFFYAAEDYHQDYYKKSKLKYKYYRSRSGRDSYLNKVWEDEVDQIDEIPKKNE